MAAAELAGVLPVDLELRAAIQEWAGERLAPRAAPARSVLVRRERDGTVRIRGRCSWDPIIGHHAPYASAVPVHCTHIAETLDPGNTVQFQYRVEES